MQSMTINGTALGVKEFKGRRIVTFSDIDAVHKRPSGTARRAFHYNRKYFIEGRDYFLPKGWKQPEQGNVRNSYMGVGEAVQGDVRETYIGLEKILPNLASPKGITLITESGYLMLVKSFGDDLAWAIQCELVNCYFKVHRPETPPLFTNKALVPVESKCRLPEKSILNDGKRVVDTPRNREAQQIMTDIKSATSALPVILGLFNRYQSEAEAESYKKVVFDSGMVINRLCNDLGQAKLNLIEQPK